MRSPGNVGAVRSLLARFGGSAGARWQQLRSHPRSAASAGFVSVAAIGLLVAMFLSDGFRATTYDLEDASVWVTRSDPGQLGRINTQIARQDAVLAKQFKGLSEVVQDGRTVLIVDPAGKQLVPVDPAKLATFEPVVSVPDGARADLGGGTLVVHATAGEAAGAVWIGDGENPTSIAATERDPDLELGDGGDVAVGPDGSVVAYSAAGGRLIVVDGDARSEEDAEFDGAGSGQVQVTLAGDRPAALDTEEGVLLLGGGRRVDLSSFGQGAQLQLPGDDPSQVIVATDRGLVSVPTDGGDPEWVEEVGLAGPVRPVRLNGCTYGAWGSMPTEVVACSGWDTVTQQLEGAPAGAELRFRTNRKNVVLNELTKGGAWVFTDGKVEQADQWEQPPTSSPTTVPDDDPDRPQDLSFNDEENEPPRAEDDHLGARPGRASILTVLDNDVDPNGDLLIISEVEQPDGLNVAIVNQGQALQVTPPSDAAGKLPPFSYTVTDGREKEPNSDTAQVFLTITSNGENGKPALKEGRQPRLKVEAGKSATYDVLQDWVDPDGDPIFLAAASASDGSDTVHPLPSGLLRFDAGPTPGLKEVEVTVRDAPAVEGTGAAEGTGVLQVQVEPASTAVPPVARPDYASLVEGASTKLFPLRNDSDANGDPLRLARLTIDHLGPGLEVTMSAVDDSITVTARAAGSFVFGYEVTDGTHTVPGLVRVDVRSGDVNRPPSAGRDLVVLPVKVGARQTIDLLANDVDPDGDVLVVTSIRPKPGARYTAQLLEHRRLRVSVTGALPSAQVLEYTVSDGQASAQGEVVIVSTDGAATNQPPVLEPDAVTVRAGDVVSIPVLANDVDPEGDDLTVLPDLPTQPPSDRGLAFVSGSVVRFVAPERPMTVRFDYSATDGENTASSQIAVTVLGDGQNAPPVAPTIEARVLAGSTVKIPIPLAGIDPDGDSVRLEGIGVDAPQLGRAVTPVGTDSITYEAFRSSAGSTDSFTYRVSDHRGARAEGVIRVGVAPRPATNGPPQPGTDRVEIRPDGVVRVPVLANDYDPDGDPLALGDPAIDFQPEGVTAEVEGVKIRIEAPSEVRQLQPLIYQVTDGRGGSAYGNVEIVVREDARGLPPIARDDDARVADADAREVEVDVTANDDDPDGLVRDLRVDSVGDHSGVSVKDERMLVVTLGESPRVVPYRITDTDGLTATAIVRVPAAGSAVNRPPVQRRDAPKLEAVDGEELAIAIGDFVEDPEGEPVRLTTGNRVSATNGDARAVDESNISFTPRSGYTGQASITFEVTDGDTADSAQRGGNAVVVTLPITVRSTTNTPPSFQGGLSLAVAPKEAPQRLDLRPLVDDPDPGDLEELKFEIEDEAAVPAGVTVNLDGSVLEASAEGDATGTGQLVVSVTDGNDESQATVTIEVVESRRPMPTCTQAVIDKVDVGEPVTRNLLQDCFNPFPDDALRVTALVVDRAVGEVRPVGDDSMEFEASRGFVGDALIRYTVEDAVGRTADGLVSVTIRDVPAKPSPPTVVEVASRTVTLTWQPPAANGAPIERYEVAWEGGSQTCPQTTCAIVGLRNNQTYRFTVRALNEVGWGEPSDPSLEARPDQKPEPPTNVVLAFSPDRTDGRLTASWDPAVTEGSPISGYEVQISPAPPAGDPQSQLGVVTEHEWTGLENGTTYRVRVRAINAAPDPSEWSVDSNPESPARAPAPPEITSVQRVADPLGELIEVSWNAPTDDGGDALSGYTLEASRGAGEFVATTTLRLEAGLRSQVVDVDDVRNPYRFRIRAHNKAAPADDLDAANPSEPSDAVQASGNPADIGQVVARDNQGTTGLDRRATITFARPDDRGDALTRYEVRWTGGGSRSFTTNLTDPNPTFAVTGLVNGQSYDFNVTACNRNGCGQNPSPSSNTATPYGPVGTPSVRVSGVSSSGSPTITFSWSPPATNGRAIARVEISVNGGPWANAPLSGSHTTGSGYNQLNSIRVRAIDSAGQIGTPGSAEGRTRQPPPPPPQVIASWGSQANVAGCGGGCRRMVATVSGFPANRSFPVACQYRTSSAGAWLSDFGWTPPNLVTDGNGSGNTGDTSSNCHGNPNGAWEYRFVINGVASNAIG